MAAIVTRQLTRVHTQRSGWAGKRSVVALDSVDLEIGEGEVFGLLGLNGAGKSTLVRILCGLMLPSSGSARVLGCDVERDAARIRAAVGLASGDERSFSWRLSARRNLLFFAQLRGMAGKAASARVDELLALFGLDSVATRPVGALSAGMRQKLALARALIGDDGRRPRVLFLDEPTRGLDLRAADALLELIVDELAASGTTVVLTTHRTDEAERVCRRVGVLSRGRLVAQGAPAELVAALGAGTQYTFELARPVALPDTLRGRVDARDVAGAAPPSLRFVDSDGSLAAVLSFLAEADVAVTSIATRAPTLEDAFRRQTVNDEQ